MSEYFKPSAYICARRGCETLYKEPVKTCGVCGGREIKPFYDFYNIFDLKNDFSEVDLKKSYKKLSLKYHPDLNPDGKDTFLIIAEGYHTLQDRGTKEKYDYSLNRVKNGDFSRPSRPQYSYSGSGSGFSYTETSSHTGGYGRSFREEDFEDIFKHFYGFRQKPSKRYRKTQISSRLGSILGALAGIALGGFVLSFPLMLIGIFLGRFLGGQNPEAAPLLLILTNIFVILIAGGLLVTSLFTGNIFFIAIILFAIFFYFQNSVIWRRELRE